MTHLHLVETAKPEPILVLPLLLFLETASEILLAYSEALLVVAESLRKK